MPCVSVCDLPEEAGKLLNPLNLELGIWEPPDMGAGTELWSLRLSSKCSAVFPSLLLLIRIRCV